MSPFCSTALSNRLGVVVGGASLILAAGLLMPLDIAEAQGPPDEMHIIDGHGGGPDMDAPPVRRGFVLFGGADAAFSGMQATGNYGTGINNYGDCGTLRNCAGNQIYNVPRGGSSYPYHDMDWVYGVPPSQFVKIRAVAPSVANATGGGWMAAYNRTWGLRGPLRFAPHDGTLGRMFSGVTSTNDGSCRDHTGDMNGRYGTGLQLLPVFDCPETWGSEGWRGAHPIDQLGWKELFDQRGTTFTFDFWRVPEEQQRTDKPYLGTNHHTYGETSDYNTEVLANYGAVVPGGSGAPVAQGYPLGLLIHFEAFNFSAPTVNSGYFVQVTIVNRSEDLWGAPIDYDSLYFGLSQGTHFGGDNNSRYGVPDQGLVLYHESNVQGPGGPCDDPSRSPYGTTGCAGNSSTVRGYGAGSTALIFLKSPLGDVRNKLFTRTAAGTPCTVGLDPFCNPLHTLRGDTITFNRLAFGDYGGASNATWGTSVRAAFGFMAGMEENTLDGRSINDWNERTQWRTFRSERWPVEKAYYNKYVPPASPPWDYNHDGTPDTLAMQTCGQFGCAAVDSDTLPGGWKNKRGSDGGLQSFGPFSLAAGDTTSLIYAHFGGGDSTQFWAQVNAAIELYLNFYLAPDPPPPAQIVSTQITPGTDARGTISPQIRFFFSDDPERWTDPYLMKLADDVETSASFTDLFALNPDLPDSIRARAADNLERIEIYKSCDGGETFTADADCQGDPTVDVDGSAPGLGWRSYAEFTPDGDGNILNAFSDNQVEDGHSYLYVVVAKSRGAEFAVNTATGAEVMTFAPSLRNSLARTAADPNVVSVYVPVSRQSGYQPARVEVTSQPVGSTAWPIKIDLTDAAVGGAYRVIFGNEIVVERGALVVSYLPVPPLVTIRRRETVSFGNIGIDTIMESRSFLYESADEFPVAGTGVEGISYFVGDTVRTPATYAGVGFLVVGDRGPIFGSTALAGDDATPSMVMGRPNFPGFMVSASQYSAGKYNAEAARHVRGSVSLADLDLLPSDTVVPRDLVDEFMVQWLQAASTNTEGVGLYRINWADDPFGVDRGFVLNLQNPSATEAEVRAALAARSLPTTGVTDHETALLLRVDQSSLVAVKVPFTVHNVTFDRPVEVAMGRRPSNRIQLGDGRDTVSVEVPEDQWVPGDRLIFIEGVTEDSTDEVGLVLGDDGAPLQRTRRAVTFTEAVLGCASVRISCNPVTQTIPGATGYGPLRDGDRTEFQYYAGFTPTGVLAFQVVPPVTGDEIAVVTDSALSLIRVVPNPYVLYSSYQTSVDAPRLVFTNMPPRGTLRIYTVSGQFVQQITWVPADLLGDGDLFWNLMTQGGNTVASGLYLWVLTAPSTPGFSESRPIQARGKFVVIRGHVG